MIWVLKRELHALILGWSWFLLSIGFIGLNGLYLFWFYPFFIEGRADLSPFFEFAGFLQIFFLPSLSMGVFAEERQQGRLGFLRSLPVSDRSWVWGKFLGVWIAFIVCLGCTIWFPLCIEWSGMYTQLEMSSLDSSSLFSERWILDWGHLSAGYIGLVGLGTLQLSLGVWASSLSQTSLSSWILSFGLCFSLYALGLILPNLPSSLGVWIEWLSADFHLDRCIQGMVDLGSLGYFLGGSWLCLSASEVNLHRETHLLDSP
jgi:ABC-2 type transport system permease protein